MFSNSVAKVRLFLRPDLENIPIKYMSWNSLITISTADSAVLMCLLSKCLFVYLSRLRVSLFLLPMQPVHLLYPSVTFPARYDSLQRISWQVVTLQGGEVVEGEGWWQLVKHGVVGSISLTLALGIHILLLQGFTKGAYLLVEGILSHHQGKVNRWRPLPSRYFWV